VIGPAIEVFLSLCFRIPMGGIYTARSKHNFRRYSICQ
jgi:hypothetical protein